MFENLKFLLPLEETRFEEWLEAGRKSKLSYTLLVVLWDEMEKDYRPVYLTDRNDLEKYQDDRGNISDVFVAAYDLYSESKIV
ncbi:hypothetical protein [Ekhidna sp.]|uniref:hypothetical protein n=1 Tax=Ekhidna sp. TaxID=2608089 RepID=UPI00355A0A54